MASKSDAKSKAISVVSETVEPVIDAAVELPVAIAEAAVIPLEATVPVIANAIEAETPLAKPVVAKKARVAKAIIAKPVVAKTAKAKPVIKADPVKVEPIKASKISSTGPKKLVPLVKTAPAASSPVKKVTAAVKAIVPPQSIAAVEKVQIMFADMNDRAKAALEKTAKAGEELTEFTKGNMEAMVVSAKTAAKGAETLGQEMAEYGKKSFETASATMKSMATVKTPTELFQIQSEYAKSAFDSAVAEASKFSEAWLKLTGDVFQPLSSRYALAAEKFKAAAL